MPDGVGAHHEPLVRRRWAFSGQDREACAEADDVACVDHRRRVRHRHRRAWLARRRRGRRGWVAGALLEAISRCGALPRARLVPARAGRLFLRRAWARALVGADAVRSPAPCRAGARPAHAPDAARTAVANCAAVADETLPCQARWISAMRSDSAARRSRSALECLAIFPRSCGPRGRDAADILRGFGERWTARPDDGPGPSAARRRESAGHADALLPIDRLGAKAHPHLGGGGDHGRGDLRFRARRRESV